MTSRASRRILAIRLLAFGCFAGAARARSGDETLRISNTPGGAPGNSGSYLASISRDGNVIAFASTASDLVAGDTNGVADVFVFDRTTGLIERVSVATDGTQSDGESNRPVLSGEGRYVAFDAFASNLAGDGGTGLNYDVFLHDRITRRTIRVSSNASGAAADGWSLNTAMTPDGRFILYESNAPDLVAGDTNGKSDVFRFDVKTGATLRVSTTSAGAQANGDCVGPFVSDEGNFIAFSSYATNFPNAHYSFAYAVNAFRKSLATGVLERVDVDWKGVYPFASSVSCGISADGESISFQSEAPYVPDDTNREVDGYIRDLVSGNMERLTVRTGGGQLDGPSGGVELTPDARYAMFWTLDLDGVVPGDDNGHMDLFLRDRRTGITSILTIGTFDEPCNTDNSSFGRFSLSGDGKHVVFHSHATTFAPDDHNRAEDVFLRIRGSRDASWTRYGEGFRGRLGLPSIALSTPPWRGAAVELEIGNSAGDTTLALILIGSGRVDLPTSLGGHLLVLPITTVSCLIDLSGGVCPMEVPTGWQFAGATFDLQALELDPGAARGVSFTRGLEAVLGD